MTIDKREVRRTDRAHAHLEMSQPVGLSCSEVVYLRIVDRCSWIVTATEIFRKAKQQVGYECESDLSMFHVDLNDSEADDTTGMCVPSRRFLESFCRELWHRMPSNSLYSIADVGSFRFESCVVDS